MEAEIIFKKLDTKSIAQMWEDLLTQPCVIIGESSKHSSNSLRGWLSCSVRDTGHWQMGSQELQFGISD